MKKAFVVLGGLTVIAAIFWIDAALPRPWGHLLSREGTANILDVFRKGAVQPYKPVADYENAVVEAVKRVSPAVVSISISKEVPVVGSCVSEDPFSGASPEIRRFFGQYFPQYYMSCENTSEVQEVGGGSGFLISEDGLIITNKHVVEDAEASYTVFTNEGKKYTANVLARDPIQDLAVLKIDGRGLPTVTLGNSDELALGQTAIAIGNALGEFKNTVGVGIISGLGRSITAAGAQSAETIQGVIQTDAAINPGNSGGPLVNLRGEVVGVNVAVVQGAQNIGFALPINWAKADIQAAQEGKGLTAPYIGVRYIMLTPSIAKTRKLKAERGALVTADDGLSVERGSPASRAGIRDQDIILSIDGESLEGKDLLNVIRRKRVGDTVELVLLREEKEVQVSLTLGERVE